MASILIFNLLTASSTYFHSKFPGYRFLMHLDWFKKITYIFTVISLNFPVIIARSFLLLAVLCIFLIIGWDFSPTIPEFILKWFQGLDNLLGRELITATASFIAIFRVVFKTPTTIINILGAWWAGSDVSKTMTSLNSDNSNDPTSISAGFLGFINEGGVTPLYVGLYLASLILFLVMSVLFSSNLITTSAYSAYLSIKTLLFLIFSVFSFFYFGLLPSDKHSWHPLMVQNTTLFKTTSVAFEVSRQSFFFSSLVLFIFFGVLSFAYPYMLKEQKRFKFLILLFFFASSMLLFFHAKSLLLLVLAWKCIGATSFFLIGHYNTKVSVFKSSFKAMFFNIFSDLVFVLFIAVYYKTYGTFEILTIEVVKAHATDVNFYFFSINSSNILGFLLFSFASIKSAQGIFFVWLLDSMEAPVPASALIHSATLVVTGVYISAILGHFFLITTFMSGLVVPTLLITALVASICACYQKDLKKALAFSTISNTSLAFLATVTNGGELYSNLAIAHGLIKSLCFLICGYFFFLNNHVQDSFFFNKPRSRAVFKLSSMLFFIFSALPISPFYSFKHGVASITLALGWSNSTLITYFMILISLTSLIYGLTIVLRLSNEKSTGFDLSTPINAKEESSSKIKPLTAALLSFTVVLFSLYLLLIIYQIFIFNSLPIDIGLINFISDFNSEDALVTTALIMIGLLFVDFLSDGCDNDNDTLA